METILEAIRSQGAIILTANPPRLWRPRGKMLLTFQRQFNPREIHACGQHVNAGRLWDFLRRNSVNVMIQKIGRSERWLCAVSR